MIEEVNSIISQKAAEEDLLFRAKIKGCEDRYVMMDTEYVERILINLLSNAVKFSKPGGTVDFVTNVTYKNGRARHVYTITARLHYHGQWNGDQRGIPQEDVHAL